MSLIEPLMPLADGMHPEKRRMIDNLVSELIGKSASLNERLHPIVQNSIGDLVRSMNCYYSNLIENHNTHPVDIEKALHEDYSAKPEIRNLQLEARAHISVQKEIDSNHLPCPVISDAFIQWIHKRFYQGLPEALQLTECTTTHPAMLVMAGEYRTHDVQVGQHLAIPFAEIPAYMQRFIMAYGSQHLNYHEKVVAVAASHHRLLWIHPFLDGNGRTARLFSHAFLKEVGVGNSLWSISRGLARTSEKYKQYLARADNKRQGDLDGRGSLSLSGLQDFCIYFLEQCIDQVEFMGKLLRPNELIERIDIYAKYQVDKKQMHPKAFKLLKEALFMGEFSRGAATDLLDMSTSHASKILNDLSKLGLLVSDTPKGNVRLGFPYKVLTHWLPGIYPENL